MQVKLTLAQKGLLLVAVPLAFELTCVGILFSVWQESRNQTAREIHGKVIIAEVNSIMRVIMHAANACLLNGALPDNPLRDEQENSLREIGFKFHTLDNLIQDDPIQKAFADKAYIHLQKIINNSRRFDGVTLLSSGEKLRVLVILNKEVRSFDADMSKMLDTQMQRENALDLAEASSQRTINTILLTLIFSSIALAVGMAVYFNTQAASRLAIVMNSIKRLSAGQSGSLPLKGADEFALLDQDIHGMAAKLLEATHKERAVIENALDVIFSINTKGQFTAVNPAAAKVWGYGQDALLTMTLSDLLVDQNRQEVINQLREAAISQKACSLEATTTAANGARIEQLWSASWSKSEQTLFCVAHDISERKRVEQLKQEFVAMITHDLRTPLASIKAMLELLAGPNSDLSPEWRERVRKSEESSARLISLISDLLDLEKMQAGKLVIAPDVCLIDDLIQTSMEAVQSFADGRKIKLSHQRSGLLVVADERRLIQVIVNLLSNAVKFSPQQSTVEVITRAAGKLVELRVSDRGRGIPAANQKSIFNRFEQLSAADHVDKGGTGLGLAICQEIIKVHGGQIGVESQEGSGSTFWFRLPSAE